MKENILKDKTFIFALEGVKFSQFLISEKKEFVISKQFLRSGNAIWALVREAEYAQSLQILYQSWVLLSKKPMKLNTGLNY